MKAILPILICSAITGALGYYFGHITVPADLSAPAPAVASSTTNSASAPSVPEVTIATPEVEPEAMPAEVEPDPVQPPQETTSAAEPSQTSYAERAALTTQTLTDTQGRTIQASIVKVLDTAVKIRRTDGLETTIPLNMLSDEDVAFCNYLRDQQTVEEEVKKPDTSDGFDWDSYFNS